MQKEQTIFYKPFSFGCTSDKRKRFASEQGAAHGKRSSAIWRCGH
jgi:hypothetical protein